MKKGKVYLVGAGPGDPKLITLKGMEALKKSDAIVYDRLASPRLLKHTRPDVQKIYVGKLPDRHTLSQEEINQLLVDLALEGKVVTRLKGGDPCVFGRVGEEAELLVDNGIEFEIVPGITSAIAVPAYAGIPVTHRDFNSSFSIITGHEKPEKLDSTINWQQLSTSTETLIFLMGVAKIKYISDQLIKHGKSEHTPVALIRWGTTSKQQTLIGTLATITQQVEDTNFQPPAIILVGEVIKLREKLLWFEKKPLFGKRVLVTRSRSQSSELADLIDELGGEAIEFPVIQMRSPSDDEKLRLLDLALKSLTKFDWTIFTSVNGVEFFFQRLQQLNIDIRTMNKATIAAVGPKTAKSLIDRGLCVESLPATFQAEGLLEQLLPQLKAGEQVLLPRADIARRYLPDKLTELGLEVTEVDVYETTPASEGVEEIITQLQNKEINVITFTSSSTVQNLVDVIKQQNYDPISLFSEIDLVSIGPVTTQTAESLGLHIKYTAEEATISALVDVVAQQL